jgi:hypothetical protein
MERARKLPGTTNVIWDWRWKIAREYLQYAVATKRRKSMDNRSSWWWVERHGLVTRSMQE